MYSKFLRTAMLMVAALQAACSTSLPWEEEPVGQEVNVAFSIRKNLIVLPSVTVDGHPGTFLLGSAAPRTLLDPRYAPAAGRGRHALQLNEREALQFTPLVTDLRGVADAVVGADVWGSNAIVIDYRVGILTFQRNRVERSQMVFYRYDAAPMINVTVDDRVVSAIVDTSSPDTLVLPRAGGAAGRRKARVRIADTDFGVVDVLFADVEQPRAGNRLLSKFLVAIDYGQKQVGLWRDPRIAL